MNTSTASEPVADLQAQREYVVRMKDAERQLSLVVADAFVRGIRDLGYRHTGTSLDELIDNSIQAGASKVHIALGFRKGSDAKPSELAVIDNGHGMDPDMERLAVVWGGTHRENDRKGFGRFGYGLPSAAVSMGKRYSVISRVDGGEFWQVTVDIDDISAGKYTRDGVIVVPEPVPAALPKWIADYVAEHFGEFLHGTIVLIEKLDRIRWSTSKGLEGNLLPHFGSTYRNFLRSVEIVLNGKSVQPVDPLFLTPGARFYDVDEDRAEALPDLAFEVKSDETGEPGMVHVRFASFPVTFASIDKAKAAQGKNENGRLAVMKAHNGIIVCRAGRQIDVVTACPWTHFLTNDRYWGIEVNFPPTLDEEFKLTTSKQQVVISERIWTLLREHGVMKAISELRERYTIGRSQREEDQDRDENQARPSETVMAEADKFKTATPTVDSVEREKQSQEQLELEAARRARQSGVRVEDVTRQLREETETRPYKVMREQVPGAPFYRMVQLGGQKVLYLNVSHRFYTECYAAPDSTPRLRSALEVLLLVMGSAELDATDDRQHFYAMERANWSNMLNITLDLLQKHKGIDFEEADIDMVSEVGKSEGDATQTA